MLKCCNGQRAELVGRELAFKKALNSKHGPIEVPEAEGGVEPFVNTPKTTTAQAKLITVLNEQTDVYSHSLLIDNGY